MIEGGRGPRSREWKGKSRTTICALSFLLLVSLAGNAILLSSLLRSQDLDAVSVKHTSEYCR